MTEFVQQVVNGIILGSFYGLLAVAIALVFGVLEIPQFAFGAYAMVAGYACYFAAGATGYWGGLVVGVAVTALLGLIVQAGVFDRLRHAPPATMFVAAFGILLVLQGGAQEAFSPDVRTVNYPISGGFVVFGAHVLYFDLVSVGAVIAAVVFLNLILHRTQLGRQIRACGQERVGAQVTGISMRRIALITMAIGSALAGLSGVLLAPESDVFPTVGNDAVIYAFTIVVLAGMGSITGALVAGYIVGLVLSLGGAYVSDAYGPVLPLLVFVVVLVIRPQGLFARSRARV